MKDPIGDGLFDLQLRPVGMTVPKAGCHELPHASIHPQSLLQPLPGRHRAVDRHLPLRRGTDMIGLRGHGHHCEHAVELWSVKNLPNHRRAWRNRNHERRDTIGLDSGTEIARAGEGKQGAVVVLIGLAERRQVGSSDHRRGSRAGSP
jgi:hypothetical protein